MSKSVNKDAKRYKSGRSCWSCEDHRCCCGERSRAASNERFEKEVTTALTSEDPPDEMCFDSGIRKRTKSKKVCPNGEKHDPIVIRYQAKYFNTSIIRCKKCNIRLKRIWRWHGDHLTARQLLDM